MNIDQKALKIHHAEYKIIPVSIHNILHWSDASTSNLRNFQTEA